MKSLYITSVEKYSGKTALCLALGKLYQERGLSIGYLKPFSLRPWRIGDKIADEDASFVIDILGINAKPWPRPSECYSLLEWVPLSHLWSLYW